MQTDRTAIERAFDLASTGRFASVSEIKRAVSAEGYFTNQLEGPVLARQLRAKINAARETKPA